MMEMEMQKKVIILDKELWLIEEKQIEKYLWFFLQLHDHLSEDIRCSLVSGN